MDILPDFDYVFEHRAQEDSNGRLFVENQPKMPFTQLTIQTAQSCLSGQTYQSNARYTSMHVRGEDNIDSSIFCSVVRLKWKYLAASAEKLCNGGLFRSLSYTLQTYKWKIILILIQKYLFPICICVCFEKKKKKQFRIFGMNNIFELLTQNAQLKLKTFFFARATDKIHIRFFLWLTIWFYNFHTSITCSHFKPNCSNE